MWQGGTVRETEAYGGSAARSAELPVRAAHVGVLSTATGITASHEAALFVELNALGREWGSRMRRASLACMLLIATLPAALAHAAEPIMRSDAAGRPIEVSSPGRPGTTKLGYDDGGRLSRVVEPDGAVTELGYDASGRLSQLRGADALVQRFDYDVQGRLSAMRENGVETLNFSYDDKGRVASVRGIGGAMRKLEYAADGALSAIVDSLGRRTVMKPLPRGGGRSDGISFDPDTHRITISDEGGTSSIVVDADVRPVAETDRFGLTLRRGYDSVGRLNRIEHADGRVETVDYDVSGRPAYTTDGLGAKIATEWNRYGKLTRLSVNGKVRATRSYDRDRLIGVTDAAGGKTSIEYDLAGRPAQVTDPGGEAAFFTWDTEGEMTKSIAANGYTLRFAYGGPADQPTEITLPKGASPIRLSYDTDGRLMSRTGPDGSVVRFAYDAEGRPVSQDVDGRKITLRRDSAGRMVSVDDPAAPITWTYDQAGRLTAVSGVGGKVSYGLNNDGMVASVTAPSGAVLAWHYDSLQRPIAVKLPVQGGEIGFAWALGGRLKEIRLPNGVVGRWSYFADGRLADLEWIGSSGKPVAAWHLSYDARGLPIAVDAPDGKHSFAYDREGRLTQQRHGVSTVTYTYAPGGDRTGRSEGARRQTLAYRDGMLAGVDGGEVRHDPENRVTAIGRIGFSWDRLGRLASRHDGDSIQSFTYDLFGGLVSADDGGGRTRFAYDRDQLLEATGSDGKPTLYVHAPGLDRPVAILKDGQWRFLVTDWMGSVVATLDAGGRVVARYEADAFGAGDAAAARDVGLAFQGRPCFAAARLCWFRQRWYAPEIGRFLSPDPRFGTVEDPQSLNPYVFARNAPTAYHDPYGAAPWNYVVDYRLESQRTGVPETVLRDLARDVYTQARTPDANGYVQSPRSAAISASEAIRQQADWVWHMRNGTYGAASQLTPQQAVNIMRSNLRLEPRALVVPAAGSASNPAVAVSETPPVLPAQSAGGTSSGTVNPNEVAIGELFDSPAPSTPRVPTIAVDRPPLDPAAPPRVQTLAVNNRPASAGPGAAESSASAAEPGTSTVRSVAAGLAVGAVVNGVTQSANCYARGGTAAQCAEAFGVGSAVGIAGGVAGTLVVASTATVIKATATAAAATAFTSAVAVGATAYGFGQAGAAVGGAANTAIYGTAAQAQASAAALAALDSKIAELGDLDKAAKETLAEPLKRVKDMEAEFGALISGKVENSPAAAGQAEQALSEACAAARSGLNALDQIAAAVADPALDAVERLRDAESPGDAADDTKIAVEVVKHAVFEAKGLEAAGMLAANALNDVAAGLAAGASSNAADDWRGKVAAYNQAVDLLAEAADAAAERKRQFNDRKTQFAADARGLRPGIRETDLPAFSRRSALIDSASFSSGALIDEARAAVRSAPNVMAMAVKAIEKGAGASRDKTGQREVACARFQEGAAAVGTVAAQARNGALRQLDGNFARIAGAIEARSAKIAEAEAKNARLLVGARKKLAEAKAAADPTAAAEAQRLVDSALNRQKNVLEPQKNAIAEARAAVAPVRISIQSAISAFAAITP